MNTTPTAEQLDIRDINPGEVYYTIASEDKGGRCILSGCFIAVWKDKKSAKQFAAGKPGLTVVKCLKPAPRG